GRQRTGNDMAEIGDTNTSKWLGQVFMPSRYSSKNELIIGGMSSRPGAVCSVLRRAGNNRCRSGALGVAVSQVGVEPVEISEQLAPLCFVERLEKGRLLAGHAVIDALVFGIAGAGKP